MNNHLERNWSNNKGISLKYLLPVRHAYLIAPNPNALTLIMVSHSKSISDFIYLSIRPSIHSSIYFSDLV